MRFVRLCVWQHFFDCHRCIHLLLETFSGTTGCSRCWEPVTLEEQCLWKGWDVSRTAFTHAELHHFLKKRRCLKFHRRSWIGNPEAITLLSFCMLTTFCLTEFIELNSLEEETWELNTWQAETGIYRHLLLRFFCLFLLLLCFVFLTRGKLIVFYFESSVLNHKAYISV